MPRLQVYRKLSARLQESSPSGAPRNVRDFHQQYDMTTCEVSSARETHWKLNAQGFLLGLVKCATSCLASANIPDSKEENRYLA